MTRTTQPQRQLFLSFAMIFVVVNFTLENDEESLYILEFELMLSRKEKMLFNYSKIEKKMLLLRYL